jgi:hypothetical protein
MTNEKLVRYLSVCADLADKSDGIANVRVDHLRQAIALLSDEPRAKCPVCDWERGFHSPMCTAVRTSDEPTR